MIKFPSSKEKEKWQELDKALGQGLRKMMKKDSSITSVTEFIYQPCKVSDSIASTNICNTCAAMHTDLALGHTYNLIKHAEASGPLHRAHIWNHLPFPISADCHEMVVGYTVGLRTIKIFLID